jgi:hypothetical protein
MAADMIFLTGFSLGEDVVFWFVSYPRGERFQRLWAVDPALQSGTPVPPSGRPVLLHYGSAMGHLVRDFKKWAGLVSCPCTTVLNGGRLVCDLRLDHVAACRTAYGEEAPYKWLLRDTDCIEAKD